MKAYLRCTDSFSLLQPESFPPYVEADLVQPSHRLTVKCSRETVPIAVLYFLFITRNFVSPEQVIVTTVPDSDVFIVEICSFLPYIKTHKGLDFWIEIYFNSDICIGGSNPSAPHMWAWTKIVILVCLLFCVAFFLLNIQNRNCGINKTREPEIVIIWKKREKMLRYVMYNKSRTLPQAFLFAKLSNVNDNTKTIVTYEDRHVQLKRKVLANALQKNQKWWHLRCWC